jgi:hypothetical protein
MYLGDKAPSLDDLPDTYRCIYCEALLENQDDDMCDECATPSVLEIELCTDCLYVNANGWKEEETGRPLPDPEPMSLLTRYLVSENEECSGEAHFGKYPCDGCGTKLFGSRYCCVAVLR